MNSAQPDVFTGVFQVGIVVNDLDATVRTYADLYGIGPWAFYDMDPSTMTDVVADGEPRGYRCRIAIARMGNTELELIEPLDDHSRHARFLREKGEGVEHVCLRHGPFDQTRALLLRNGRHVTTAGTWEGTRFEFYDTADDLKVDLEIQEWPFDQPYPPALTTYPPARKG